MSKNDGLRGTEEDLECKFHDKQAFTDHFTSAIQPFSAVDRCRFATGQGVAKSWLRLRACQHVLHPKRGSVQAGC